MTAEGERFDLTVIGCGAAGMFAAIHAAQVGASVIVLEQNEKAGKKLYISGKGRCNLTNDCEKDGLLSHILHGEKFLYSAVHGTDSADVQRFFTERGCPLKTERGGRVFPVSDKSSDIIRVLTKEMERLRVRVRYGATVRQLLLEAPEEGISAAKEQDHAAAKGTSAVKHRQRRMKGVLLGNGERILTDAVIIATGGLSYPATGATGDGHRFAQDAGHSVTPCLPSLVPFETKERWHRDLQGLSLKNVRLCTVRDAAEKKDGTKKNAARKPFRFDGQGELLFTHFGVSGPLVLTASAYAADWFLRDEEQEGGTGQSAERTLSFSVDLKPALTAEELDARLQRVFAGAPRRQFKNSLSSLFPSKLIPVMCALAAEGIPADDTDAKGKEALVRIPPETPCGSLTRTQRLSFGALMKRLPVTVTGTRGFAEAIVTRGGVNLKEINPSTMASKCCAGLYFAGEVTDCDALTGGFNLQIAWSTGALAGKSAAVFCKSADPAG